MTVRARSPAALLGEGAKVVFGFAETGDGVQRCSALAALILSGLVATPASAQVNGSIDIESDYRLRGYSLSVGRPAVTAQIGYDDASGVYLNLSATGVLDRDDEPLFLGVQGNVGYVRRLDSRLSIDGGVLRSQYRSTDKSDRSHKYTEIYLGLASGLVSARVYYSPDYRSDVSTLYGEVEATMRPAKDWRLNGHVGSLVYLSAPDGYFPGRVTRYDWRVGLSRRFGNFDLHAALSGGRPGKEYYWGNRYSKIALTAGANWSF